MNREEIEKAVREILSDRLDIDIERIKLDSDLTNDLGVDSFLAVELAFELKERFGVDIPDSELVRLHTVKEIVGIISGQKGGIQ